jgi:hypothetical protein
MQSLGESRSVRALTGACLSRTVLAGLTKGHAMNTNEIPRYDASDKPTGCCARFHPEQWDGLELHFEDKPFVRASTISLFHVPMNMGEVFSKTLDAINEAHAESGGYVVLSHESSAWHAEHLFAVDRDVPGAAMVRLSGDFLTKVFEGPYSQQKNWAEAMTTFAAERGKKLVDLYFYYPTCPRCSHAYGKNYVVGVAQVA